MTTDRTWADFAQYIEALSNETAGGRVALRRKWTSLKSLTEIAVTHLDPDDIEALLGKPVSQLDPECNDMKAVVAYAIGRGIIPRPENLAEALACDYSESPLAFLAEQSGKSFGETWAPRIVQYWLQDAFDGWQKRSGTDYYDVEWTPAELGQSIRIELKASSESPGYRFQQIRHPRLSGSGVDDYDLLLCLGVTAGSLEWWAIPVGEFARLADNGIAQANRVVIVKHHGKRAAIWNEAQGYADEGWFSMDERCRAIMNEYRVDSDNLRSRLLSVFGA